MNRIAKVSSVLVVLALLVAALMSQSATTFAQTEGEIEFDEDFYSDKSFIGPPVENFNIATITVTDADLTPARTGVARFAALGVDTSTFDVDASAASGGAFAILGGETEQVDEFVGLDGGPDAGDPADNLTFVLTESGRDLNDDGAITAADITVEVDGVEHTAVAEFTLGTSANGDFIASVTFVDPLADDAEVVLTYEMSEYDQGTPRDTPIRQSDTTVLFGSGLATLDNSKTVDSVSDTLGTVSVNVAAPITAGNVVEITFDYDVEDTEEDVVTITSPSATSLGKSRQVDGVETSPTSDTFNSAVALFNPKDFTAIDKEALRASNDLVANGGDGDGTVQVGEMRAALDAGLSRRVGRAGDALGIAVGDAAADLMALIVPVADGETLKATYVDGDPSGNRVASATIDLTPPVISLVSPVDGSSTDNTTPTLEVRVTDAVAGVSEDDIALSLNGVQQNAATSPVEDGFRVTLVPELDEGTHTWNVNFADEVNRDVQDVVGNTPERADADEDIDGELGSVTNAYEFNVDTEAPVIDGAETGIGFDEDDEVEISDSSSVKVVFDVGTGNAGLNAGTILVGDFRVGGNEPASVLVDGNNVYLKMAANLDTDDKPEVELTGSLADNAGNVNADDDATADDGIGPDLNIGTDVVITSGDVVITIVSSEQLVVAPEVYILSPDQTEADSLTATLVSGNTYTAEGEIDGSNVYTILVNAADISGNHSKTQLGLVTAIADAEDITEAINTAAADDDDLGVEGGLVVSLANGNLVDHTNGDDRVDEEDVIIKVGENFDAAVAADAEFNPDVFDPVAGTITLTDEIVAAMGDVEDEDSAAVDIADVTVIAYYSFTDDSATFEGDVSLPAPIVSPADEDETDEKQPFIIIDWRSEDGDYDDDGFDAVTITKAELDDVDVSDLLQSEEGEFRFVLLTSQLAAGELSVGDHTFVLNGEDAAGNTLEDDFSVTFEVLEERIRTIALNPGLNLISFPGMPKSEDLNDVIANTDVSSVLAYDPTVPGNFLAAVRDGTGPLEGPLAEMPFNPNLAYWVETTTFKPIEVVIRKLGAGVRELPPALTVVEGFNYLPVTVLDLDDEFVEADIYLDTIDWSRALVWNAEEQRYTSFLPGAVMEDPDDPDDEVPMRLNVGQGLIVYVTDSGVLVP